VLNILIDQTCCHVEKDHMKWKYLIESMISRYKMNICNFLGIQDICRCYWVSNFLSNSNKIGLFIILWQWPLSVPWTMWHRTFSEFSQYYSFQLISRTRSRLFLFHTRSNGGTPQFKRILELKIHKILFYSDVYIDIVLWFKW
jgi:hypothetical protein